MSKAQANGLPDTADGSAQNTRIVRRGTRRRVLLSQPSYADTLTGNDPSDDTSVQRRGRPHNRGLDIRDLCPPHAHPSHGNGRPSQGPSNISSSLLDSSYDHGHPTPLSCPAQTGVCPQSRPTFTRQTTAVRVTQGRTATVPARSFRLVLWTQRMPFLKETKTPPHSSWISCSDTPARVQNTNTSADLSLCNGISAIVGQHEACPDSDDNEWTRLATIPSVRTSQSIHRHFVSLSIAYNDYDVSLTYVSDDVVLFWQPPSVFSQWTLSPFTVDLVDYTCVEQFLVALKAHLFGADTALSAILATDDAREQKRIGIMATTMRKYSPSRQPGNIFTK